MATTGTINHQDIHHQPGAVGVGVTLHQLAQQMTNNCTSSSSVDSDSSRKSSSLCSDATAEDLIFFHTQSNPIMDFLLEGDTGSSRESLANLLDEGLGTSLDGTGPEELCMNHPTLGRNDSGVFSSDETGGIPGHKQRLVASSCSSSSSSSSASIAGQMTQSSGNGTSNSQIQQQHKKLCNRQKNTSPNRQTGPQRCVICGKTFSNASALTKHKLTHSDERKHTCSVCGKAFKRQDHLNGHMLTHRSKKPFECSAPDCGKSYCDARSLRRHVESRHGADALATMTIAATPHTDTEFSIIIPNSNPTVGGGPKIKSSGKNKRLNNGSSKNQQKSKSPKVLISPNSTTSNSSCNNSNGSNTNPNPLLCQGSSSPGEDCHGVDEDELLTSVENLLSLEDSSNSAENAAALLESSLMEMGVIHEELEVDEDETEIQLSPPPQPISINIDDNLNNNNNNAIIRGSEELCCIRKSDENQSDPVTNKNQSQLHQLLTQRAVAALVSKGFISGGIGVKNGGSAVVSESDVDAAAVTLIKESLIASCANTSAAIRCSSNNNSDDVFPPKQFHLHLSSNSTSSSANSWGSGNKGLGTSTPTSDNSEMGKSVRNLDSSFLNGIVLKCSSSSPQQQQNSLKEQLELIHQIIQQTTEESAVFSSTTSTSHSQTSYNNFILSTKQQQQQQPLHPVVLVPAGVSNSKNSSPILVSKSSNPPQGGNKNEEKVDGESKGCGNGDTNFIGGGVGGAVIGDELTNSTQQNTVTKGEDKPVECAICSRKFKNTPALNGHMRLHGGYFKKESDGKKKEPTTKETHGAPLQTASISVRALIEEKIIQRRNNAGSLSSSGASTPKTSPPTSSPSTPTKKPVLVQPSSSSPSSLTLPGNTNQFLQTEANSSIKGSSNSNSFSNLVQNNNQCLPFEDAHAEYLLIEEEVFNKVSSIFPTPDSFFSGIDESLLCESGIGSESSQISADFFNWSTNVTNSSSCGSLFTGPATPAATSTSSNGGCSDNPFTPLPTMDPVFFTPTPGSVHSHQSQSGDQDLADSPSFIYPTPPASLESHNALQSPLFPFPFPFENSPQAPSHSGNLMASSNPQLVMVSPASTCNANGGGGMKAMSINCNNVNNSANSGVGNNLLSTSISAMSPGLNLHGSELLLGTTQEFRNGNEMEQYNSISAENLNMMSNQSQQYDVKPFPLPLSTSPLSSEPMSFGGISSNSSQMMGAGSVSVCLGGALSVQGIGMQQQFSTTTTNSRVPGNEPCPIMGDSEESFRSPHRIFTLNPTSVNTLTSVSKVPKRKSLRNTLSSNLRPQSQSPPHFTPSPILSPVRSAPGLYWTFASAKLSHVDEKRKDRPRINVGANFQAVIPPLENKFEGKNNYSSSSSMSYTTKRPEEDLLWSPDSISNCFQEDVEKYLEFACCSAIPGGGRNKEYALHILNLCNGDINVAMLLLMNPEPKLPVHLFQYKYPEREKWSRDEILQFQESLLRHGKDFLEVSREVRTKSGEACVSFYQLWKKVCPEEYEKIRAVWKKREHSFTIELLKTIPLPAQAKSQLPEKSSSTKQNKSQQPSAANSRGPNGNDEFPCKICGKIFSKVKSRSAHMKSHRPPPTPPSNSPAPVLSPASAATLLENKEKVADALKKQIFGKACANLAKSLKPISSPPPPVAPFMPKIVKVESIPANSSFTPSKSMTMPVKPSMTPPPQSQPLTNPTNLTPTTTPTPFHPSTPTSAHPLQLQTT